MSMPVTPNSYFFQRIQRRGSNFGNQCLLCRLNETSRQSKDNKLVVGVLLAQKISLKSCHQVVPGEEWVAYEEWSGVFSRLKSDTLPVWSVRRFSPLKKTKKIEVHSIKLSWLVLQAISFLASFNTRVVTFTQIYYLESLLILAWYPSFKNQPCVYHFFWT